MAVRALRHSRAQHQLKYFIDEAENILAPWQSEAAILMMAAVRALEKDFA